MSIFDKWFGETDTYVDLDAKERMTGERIEDDKLERERAEAERKVIQQSVPGEKLEG